MKCPNCKAEIPEGSTFCPECSTPCSKNTTTQSTQKKPTESQPIDPPVVAAIVTALQLNAQQEETLSVQEKTTKNPTEIKPAPMINLAEKADNKINCSDMAVSRRIFATKNNKHPMKNIVSAKLNTKNDTTLSPKQCIEKQYATLTTYFSNALSVITKYNAANSKLTGIQTDYAEKIKAQIEDIHSVMDQTINGMRWDNLVIAFFGETNAGKSTIIETLRILFDENKPKGEDGLIVGDGQSDFTKNYDEYQLNIFGKPFTLIDVPGIEGKEEDFKEDITRALQQAHLVFYVQGHNKKPDAATAQKIKKYLNDWVNVYSIYNIKDSAGKYKSHHDNLLTANVNKNFALIEDTFRDILGDVYKGNIAVQGLLALCSKATFSKERPLLNKTQVKLKAIFESADAIYDFSRFNQIVELIRQKTEHFDEELVAANKQKLVALCSKTTQELTAFEQTESGDIIRLKDRIKEYDREIQKSISNTKSHLRSNIMSKSERAFSSLQGTLCGIINDEKSNDEKEQRLKSAAKDFSSKYAPSIHSTFTNEMNQLNQDLDKKQKEYLDCFKDIKSHDITCNVSIPDLDVEGIMNELEYTFKDFLKGVGSFAATVASGAAAGAAGGAFFGGLGALPGALGGAALAAISYGTGKFIKNAGSDENKRNAKNEVRKAINTTKQKAHSQLGQYIKDIKCQVDEQADAIRKPLSRDLKHIESLTTATDTMKSEINTFMQSLKQS